jgi:hypothetical protein
VLLLAVGAQARAHADPIVTAPPIGKGALIAQEHCPGALGLVGEVRGIGVLGASRAAALPVYGKLEGDRPELGLARVGLIGAHACQPLAFVLRADFAELTRLDGGTWRDRPLASGGALLDDAYVWWRPAVWAGLIAGRQKVPFSRFRQVDEALLTTGVTPFLIDRVTPHRRWGLTATGDLGAMAFAAGGYLDLAHLELRADDPMTDFVEDPSLNDRAMFAAHLEWTPRAPIGRDHQPTPSRDPWWHTVRLSAGAGLLWRARDGEDRLDFSLSGQAKLTRFAGIVELILSSDGGEVAVDAAAEAGLLVTDRVLLFARADTDVVLDQKAAGGGMAWFVTPDRRNKVTFYGWARRREPGEPRGDGAVAELQAAF